ncbi:MAG: hypothetical protein IJK28_05950 [Clostridia bacterium]|nr:hypothetical protein [Clostridia bacterium]
MMKKSLAILAILVLLTVALTACGGGNPLKGTWESSVGVAGLSVAYQLVFGGDGTYRLSTFGQTVLSGKYEVKGDKVSLDGVEVGYTVKGNQLTIRIGDLGLTTFTKK